MADLLHQGLNELHIQESLLQLLWALCTVHFLDETNHILDGSDWTLNIRPLHGLGSVLDDVEIEELT